MCQKSGEIALLKQQVREARDTAAAFTAETVSLRARVAEKESLARNKTEEVRALQTHLENMEEEIVRLNGEVADRRRRVEAAIFETAAETSSDPQTKLMQTSGFGMKQDHVNQIKRELREMHTKLHEQQKVSSMIRRTLNA
jgi:predicted  nucleic acid-binding Zn-ribbon protein